MGRGDVKAILRVLIESPYAGSPKEIEYNVAYLRAAMRDSLLRNEAPFASHGLYTLPGVLDDLNAEERSLGIEAGLAWGRFADLTAVYVDLGISPGMKYGIERALKEGRPVVERKMLRWFL